MESGELKGGLRTGFGLQLSGFGKSRPTVAFTSGYSLIQPSPIEHSGKPITSSL
jgi:hypothetical protein